MNRYAIGLGSNVGDRFQHLVDAVEEIGTATSHWQVSALYETEPVGGPDQDPYLNAVVVCTSDLEPDRMLQLLQGVERAHHRVRKVRWGARTLDLDIIATDGAPRSDDHLVIPHPRAAEREFVLRPLVDVWPEAPLGSVTASAALAELSDQGVDRLAREWVPPVSKWPSRLLVGAQFGLVLAVALALALDGTLPDGEIVWTRLLGMVLALVGLGFAFVATRRLGTAMTANPIPKPNAELVTGGPFGLVRHPIYGGLVLFLVGTAMVLDSLLGLLVIALLVPLLLVKSSFEERQLRMRHADYKAYMNRVPRRLIPFLI